MCVALVVTRHARDKGLPLDSDALVTEGGGQVLGLGRSSVQSILKNHGIDRLLAAEGGRTSRGSMNKMKEYVVFLNKLEEGGLADLEAIEQFWVDRVRDYFSAKPFTIKLDAASSLRHVIRGILSQAINRQREMDGLNYAGAMLQHLVGAKLDCSLGKGKIEHNSFSTADAPTKRPGDFLIQDVAIHVTTAPGEAVINRCGKNLDSGLKPVLVTVRDKMATAEGLADNNGMAERIDIFEVEQFVALNLYEWSEFESDGRKVAIDELIARYNELIETWETDHSLKIDIA